jgi:3-oxosteroid 1-dehydrogenase
VTTWNKSVDFLVIGSGAAGMTAAVRAHDLGGETLVVEKAPHYGGTTAVSGGVVWVPNNPLMQQLGISDSPEEALQYLEAITRGTSTTERLRTYVDAGPNMMRFMLDNTRVEFACLDDYPDYYPEVEGAKLGGRSCEPVLFDALQLGNEFQRMHPRPLEKQVPLGGRVLFGAADGHKILTGEISVARFMIKGLISYYTNFRARRLGRVHTGLTLGAALIGRLRLSLMDRGVPLWLSAPLKELFTEGDRVVGALVEKDGKPFRIEARKGVLVAAGGFEGSAEKRQKYQRAPTSEKWTGGSAFNTGDTIDLGVAVGASLDLMDDAWWCPCVVAPYPDCSPAWIMIFEKNSPGSLIVDRAGKRFMNEAATYNDVVKNMYSANTPDNPTIPAHFVFDKSYRKNRSCGPMLPIPDALLPKKLQNGFYQKDATLEGLARKIGVDPHGLVDTVRRYNRFAETGKDEDFGRGESPQDLYYAGKSDLPNPSIGPVAKPPFYAVEIYPGDLGTKGGFRTDSRARVLTEADEPILGLYAAGNCSAAVMGRTYPGAGATIGPAMTFGFIAAEDALGDGPAT